MWTRRVIAAVAVTLCVGLSLAWQQKKQPEPFALRISFGHRDTQPTDWSGNLTVQNGKLILLRGWRFAPKDTIEAKQGSWKCTSQRHVAPGKRVAVGRPDAPPAPEPTSIWPVGVELVVEGKSAEVTVQLAQGRFGFRTNELVLGKPLTFLGDQVRVERMPVFEAVCPPAPLKSEQPYQDDYPALWIDPADGRQYVAWISYRAGEDTLYVASRAQSGAPWNLQTLASGDLFRVALAGSSQGLWVVWSAQLQGNWDLYGRQIDARGHSGEVVRLTEAPGSDMWHRMVSDRRGRLWLVWQGFRNGQADILARVFDGRWHPEMRISDSAANDWDPAVVADTELDRVWIAWDTYEPGYYD